MTKAKKPRGTQASAALEKHFGTLRLETLVTAVRTFPATSRVDVQKALDLLFATRYSGKATGVHQQYAHQTLTFSNFVGNEHDPVMIGPLQQVEVDIGELEPARCLRQAMWLSSYRSQKFAALLTPEISFGRSNGLHVEVAVAPGSQGAELTRSFLDQIQELVRKAESYRGKVLSLETSHDYSGRAGAIKVHRLRTVTREDVILPSQTLSLLDRNVIGFINARPRLKGLGMPVKKGLLFYGAPGTGKTHTIHYLASQLPNHSTLLITAEQVGLLDEYFQLARFLQPAIVVIEDVDLIARAREHMRSPCEESLLNRLLNEMDGLREDAELLFILTTNHPSQLEEALASRPGRIDQAIEFPLPDEEGRGKLVDLYRCGLKIAHALRSHIVQKTERASPAFIKELMRRAAQFNLESKISGELSSSSIDAALEEMLFTGGMLNRHILGAAGAGS